MINKVFLSLLLFTSFLTYGQVYDLPLVIINTEGGEIVDEPKVMATMKVINNGTENRLSDAPNEYDGFIGIEFRGSSSQSFPKKPFGFETWDADGNDIDASFFGWPEEEDWILYPSFNEKSLMHNVFTMNLAREFGMYASRTQYVEVFVNENYQGVYVLMEKIKRDKGRVDINNLKEDENSGEDLTGGYIIKLDKNTGSSSGSWQSEYFNPPSSSNRSYYLYEHPSDITEPQREYIRNYISNFEDVMMSDNYSDPVNGYREYIDPESFIKFFLVNEVSFNVDGYRISSYLHKDKNEKLKAGPVWDFDISYGNANYCEGNRFDRWSFEFNDRCRDDNWLVPFWWNKLLEDPMFLEEMGAEYQKHRQGGFLSTANLMQMIDAQAAEIENAQERNFNRWNILGSYVWPQPEPIASTWQGEVRELKDWLTNRMAWLDENIPKLSLILANEDLAGVRFRAFPNPFTDRVTVELISDKDDRAVLSVYDVKGNLIQSQTQILKTGKNVFSMPIKGAQSAQLNLLKVQTENGEATHSFKLVRQ